MRDESGRVLLIHRTDNGYWGLPGGAMELGESITDCAIREVREETGLHATNAEPFALYTGPQYTHTNVFGDTYQLFVVAFLLTDPTGVLSPDPEEASEAAFFAPGEFPAPLARSVPETLADLATYEATGRLVAR